MAKRRKPQGDTDGQTVGPGNDKLNAVAADLGRLLGTAHGRARTWLNQRKVVVRELANIRDTAVAMLSELGVRGARRQRRKPARVKAAPVKRARKVVAASATTRKPAAQKKPRVKGKNSKAAQ